MCLLGRDGNRVWKKEILRVVGGVGEVDGVGVGEMDEGVGEGY